jgi:hypothetical protein
MMFDGTDVLEMKSEDCAKKDAKRLIVSKGRAKGRAAGRKVEHKWERGR